MRLRYSYQGDERTYEGDAAEVVLGRPKGGTTPDLDLSPDLRVSRSHARISVEGGQAWIEDLGSRLGTFVGETDIAGKGRQPLRVGEEVRVGETTLWLDSLEPPRSPSAGDWPTTAPTPEPEAPPPPAGLDLAFGDPAAGDILSTLASEAVGLPAAGDFERAARRAALLHELAIQFGEEGRLDELLATIIRRVIDVVGAGRGALLLEDAKAGGLLLVAHHPAGEPTVSVTMAARAMERKEAFLWRRPSLVLSDEEGSGGQSIMAGPVQHAMCAPLLWRGKALGALWLDSSEEGGGGFTGQDLQFLAAVAQHAAVAVANQQLQDELRQSAKMLKRLLANYSPEVGEKLMEQARRGRLRPGGTSSEVTVLVSDFRGFTRTVAAMEAEDVADLLNEYFSALVGCVFRHRGTIDKFIGDAILAVFGSPEPDPRQHAHAVEAALDMQATVKRVNAVRRERGEPTMEVGIGVHSGTVLHGFIGSEDRMEFTVIGDAVNRASRFCDGAGAGEVMISPEVYQRVWKQVKAIGTKVRTKHEGDLPAYRVDAWNG